jgi:hypothetical protein
MSEMPQRPHMFYLHGFASSARSTKAGYLAERLQPFGMPLHCPDFNLPDFTTLTMTRMLAQLESQVEQRRSELQVERAQARAEAAAVVDAAREQALQIVAGEAVPSLAAFESITKVAAPPAPPASAPSAEHHVAHQATVHPATPISAVIDAHAFATVFATVFATLLDGRFAMPAGGAPGTFAVGPSPAPPPSPAKRSFWSHARHPDVLLLGFATVIVLVVLFAWMG